jgi:hypothetical protein
LTDDHKFDKELAKIQILFTVFITIGSILFAMGVSIWIFSLGITIESGDKTGEVYKFFQQVSDAENKQGNVFMASGLAVLFVSIPLFLYRIKKLK